MEFNLPFGRLIARCLKTRASGSPRRMWSGSWKGSRAKWWSGMDNAASEAADRRVDAVLWFIENPEALEAVRDPLLKAYLVHIKKRVEGAREGECRRESTSSGPGG